MSLKELTAEKHKSAERQEFVKVMFSGNIHPHFYAAFLENQHDIYEILEVCATQNNLLSGLPDIYRSKAIYSDLFEITDNHSFKPPKLPVTKEYIDYIINLSKNSPNLLFAHIYVRHMGDLFGGQMIAKKVPGSGKFYQFENPDLLKTLIRERLDDSLADEANVCFDFAIKMFQQLMDLDIPKYQNE